MSLTLPKDLKSVKVTTKHVKSIKMDKSGDYVVIQTKDIPFKCPIITCDDYDEYRDLIESEDLKEEIFRAPPTTIHLFFSNKYFPNPDKSDMGYILDCEHKHWKRYLGFSFLFQWSKNWEHQHSGHINNLKYFTEDDIGACLGNIMPSLTFFGKKKNLNGIAMSFIKYLGSFNPEEHSPEDILDEIKRAKLKRWKKR